MIGLIFAAALDLAVAQIAQDEGFNPHIYFDTRAVETIGYGTNLQAGISEPEARALLAARVAFLEADLYKNLPWLESAPESLRIALIDMAYQLGVTGLLTFHDMLNCLELGRYEEAARHALDSEWAKETPERARRIAEQIASAN